MADDERAREIEKIILDYVASPSIGHIRHYGSVSKLVRDILRVIDRRRNMWRKWTPGREEFLRSAVACWVPTPDLCDYLNDMPGPKLTATDVEERMKCFETQASCFPDEDHQQSCLALYEKEKAEGTELSAIVRRVKERLEEEMARLDNEGKERRKKEAAAERLARQERLWSGADCPWTQPDGLTNWYCRRNGRSYRLSLAKDRSWQLRRVSDISESEKGILLGSYKDKKAASQAVKLIAYRADVTG